MLLRGEARETEEKHDGEDACMRTGRVRWKKRNRQRGIRMRHKRRGGRGRQGVIYRGTRLGGGIEVRGKRGRSN